MFFVCFISISTNYQIKQIRIINHSNLTVALIKKFLMLVVVVIMEVNFAKGPF